MKLKDTDIKRKEVIKIKDRKKWSFEYKNIRNVKKYYHLNILVYHKKVVILNYKKVWGTPPNHLFGRRKTVYRAPAIVSHIRYKRNWYTRTCLTHTLDRPTVSSVTHIRSFLPSFLPPNTHTHTHTHTHTVYVCVYKQERKEWVGESVLNIDVVRCILGLKITVCTSFIVTKQHTEQSRSQHEWPYAATLLLSIFQTSVTAQKCHANLPKTVCSSSQSLWHK
jgi:hypothetical protein